MRNITIASYAAALLLAASLAGCSGATSSLATLPASGGGQAATQSTARSAQLRTMANAMFAVHELRLPPARSKPMGPDVVDLQASEIVSANAYENFLNVYNRYGQSVMTINHDLDFPQGEWFDGQGNLYSAQVSGSRVEEYDPGQQGAAWTYTSGIYGPTDVTTDAQQNVYVTSFYGSSITEFAHRTNAVLHSCSISIPEGVTVDSAGNVYVFHTQFPGYIVKYAGGLSGCSSTTLTPTFGFEGGLKMDKSGNLLAADQTAGIKILKPPYTSVYKTIGGFCDPYNFALNPTGNLLFVADSCYEEVFVYHYPSGVYYTTLSSGYGYGNGVAVR